MAKAEKGGQKRGVKKASKPAKGRAVSPKSKGTKPAPTAPKATKRGTAKATPPKKPAPSKSKPEAAPTGLNKSELAAHFNVDRSTVDKWTARGCPALSTGGQGRPWRFDPDQVDAWRKANQPRSAGATATGGDYDDDDLDNLSLTDVQKRKEAANAKLKELELAERRGMLVDLSVVKAIMTKYTLHVRDSLMNLSVKLAPVVVTAEGVNEAKAILDKEVDGILRDAADLIPSRLVEEDGRFAGGDDPALSSAETPDR